MFSSPRPPIAGAIATSGLLWTAISLLGGTPNVGAGSGAPRQPHIPVHGPQLLSGTDVLVAAVASIRVKPMTLPEQFLHTISDPTIAYILLSVGMLGIFLELANPGAIFPGVAGGILLLLGLTSIGNLDVRWAGILLMGFAYVLFLIDLYVPSHGVLTIGGIASFAFGSFMMSNSAGSSGGVSRIAIVAVTAILSAFVIFAVGAVVRTRLKRSSTGREGMRGMSGVVRRDLNPEGFVFVAGELWRAKTLGEPISAGTVVRVIDVEGLEIIVEEEGSLVDLDANPTSGEDESVTEDVSHTTESVRVEPPTIARQ